MLFPCHTYIRVKRHSTALDMQRGVRRIASVALYPRGLWRSDYFRRAGRWSIFDQIGCEHVRVSNDAKTLPSAGGSVALMFAAHRWRIAFFQLSSGDRASQPSFHFFPFFFFGGLRVVSTVAVVRLSRSTRLFGTPTEERALGYGVN